MYYTEYTHMSVYTYTCSYLIMFIMLYIHICIYIYIYTYTYVCIHIYIYTEYLNTARVLFLKELRSRRKSPHDESQAGNISQTSCISTTTIHI